LDNKIIEKFRQGQQSLGTISHLKSPCAIECLGKTGLDFVFLDMEHTTLEKETAYTCITAADAGGITPVVRVPGVDRSAILSMLDAGARGIIVPGVETPEQVEELVRYAKFPPLGDRGYCMTRDGRWGYGEDYAGGMMSYMETCNRDTLLIPQCETAGCLAHIEEIVAMPGVDGIMVGPFDLSIALGIPGEFESPAFLSALERVLHACKQSGKLSMIFVGAQEDIARRCAQGFDSILYGLDLLVITEHYRGVVEAFEGNK